MQAPLIRSAAVEDAESVLALWHAADTHPTTTDTLPAITRLITEQPDNLLVAELDGRFIGTIIAGWDGWRGTIYRLAVTPEHRCRGVARALVNAAMHRLHSRGAVRISAFVVESDRQAIAFWNNLAGLGFVPDPRPKCRYVANLLEPGLGG